MIVKLPDSTIHRVGAPVEGGGPGLLAMSVGAGTHGEKFGGLGLVEVEPGVWAIRLLEGLELYRVGPDGEWVTGDCVTAPAVEGLVGFVLPEAVEGRKLPRHVVVRDPDGPIAAFEDLDAVKAKYGEVIVGHVWECNADRPGWLRCPRCREDKKCRHPTERLRSVAVPGGKAEVCDACAAELGRWVG